MPLLAVSIQIEKLRKLGLRQIDFKRTPRTGEYMFIDNRTGEKYITHTNGYIQRETKGGGRGPINQRVKNKQSTASFKQYDLIKEPSTITRLERLIVYMTEKNKRLQKNGIKNYGQPKPKWELRAEQQLAEHNAKVKERMRTQHVEQLLDEALPVLEVFLFSYRILCKCFIAAELPDSKGRIFLKMMSDGGRMDLRMADTFQEFLAARNINYTRFKTDYPMDSRKFFVDGVQFIGFLEEVHKPTAF